MKRHYIFLLTALLFGVTNAQKLELLIEEALVNNPEIQAFELKYELTAEKVNEANTLPNTQLGIGYFVSEPETRTGPQRFKISAKQMLPSFGAITARENYLNSVADAVFEDIAIAKRKLVASVSQSYYNLYALKEKQDILEQNLQLLKTHEELALNAVAVGKASAVDVLRIQMRQNEVVQMKQVLNQDYFAEQTKFNKLLHRDKNAPLLLEGEFTMPTEGAFVSSDNLEFHPELMKYDKLYNSVSQSELLNQKESKPMLGLGIDYIAVSERPDLDFYDNGKNIFMPMLSVSIPLFNKKYKSRSKQNELKQQELLAQKESRLNSLETLLDKAVKASNAAQISYNTQVKNLKQAQDAKAIIVKNYETGTVDFEDILALQELELKFQLNQIDSIKNYFIQRTLINYLTR
ncbi:MAG: TolC family protein [Flavobacteriaceae bacterium]|jgi:cobalt-zinc-cadmium efflux system outer membrane protein